MSSLVIREPPSDTSESLQATLSKYVLSSATSGVAIRPRVAEIEKVSHFSSILALRAAVEMRSCKHLPLPPGVQLSRRRI